MSPESQCFLVLVKIRWESVFVHKVYPRKGWKSKQNCLRDMSSQENYILCEFCYHRKITIILPYKRAMVSSVSRTLWSNSAEMTLFRSIFIWFIPTENVRNIILVPVWGWVRDTDLGPRRQLSENPLKCITISLKQNMFEYNLLVIGLRKEQVATNVFMQTVP